MANQKISDYPAITTIASDDLLDVSKFNNPNYISSKIKFSDFITVVGTSHTHVSANITDFAAAVSGNSSVSSNTTHRGLTDNNPHGVDADDIDSNLADHLTDAHTDRRHLTDTEHDILVPTKIATPTGDGVSDANPLHFHRDNMSPNVGTDLTDNFVPITINDDYYTNYTNLIATDQSGTQIVLFGSTYSPSQDTKYYMGTRDSSSETFLVNPTPIDIPEWVIPTGYSINGETFGCLGHNHDSVVVNSNILTAVRQTWQRRFVIHYGDWTPTNWLEENTFDVTDMKVELDGYSEKFFNLLYIHPTRLGLAPGDGRIIHTYVYSLNSSGCDYRMRVYTESDFRAMLDAGTPELLTNILTNEGETIEIFSTRSAGQSLSTLNITGSSGYTNALGYSFDVDDNGGNPTASLSGTFDIVGGAITNITITHKGTGYTATPIVSIPLAAGAGTSTIEVIMEDGWIDYRNQSTTDYDTQVRRGMHGINISTSYDNIREALIFSCGIRLDISGSKSWSGGVGAVNGYLLTNDNLVNGNGPLDVWDGETQSLANPKTSTATNAPGDPVPGISAPQGLSKASGTNPNNYFKYWDYHDGSSNSYGSWAYTSYTNKRIPRQNSYPYLTLTTYFDWKNDKMIQYIDSGGYINYEEMNSERLYHSAPEIGSVIDHVSFEATTYPDVKGFDIASTSPWSEGYGASDFMRLFEFGSELIIFYWLNSDSQQYLSLIRDPSGWEGIDNNDNGLIEFESNGSSSMNDEDSWSIDPAVYDATWGSANWGWDKTTAIAEIKNWIFHSGNTTTLVNANLFDPLGSPVGSKLYLRSQGRVVLEYSADTYVDGEGYTKPRLVIRPAQGIADAFLGVYPVIDENPASGTYDFVACHNYHADGVKTIQQIYEWKLTQSTKYYQINLGWVFDGTYFFESGMTLDGQPDEVEAKKPQLFIYEEIGASSSSSGGSGGEWVRLLDSTGATFVINPVHMTRAVNMWDNAWHVGLGQSICTESGYLYLNIEGIAFHTAYYSGEDCGLIKYDTGSGTPYWLDPVIDVTNLITSSKTGTTTTALSHNDRFGYYFMNGYSASSQLNPNVSGSFKFPLQKHIKILSSKFDGSSNITTPDDYVVSGTNIGGTATSGTTDLILEDTTKSWIINEYQGSFITLGTPSFASGMITSNTATTITVSELVYGDTTAFVVGDTYEVRELKGFFNDYNHAILYKGSYLSNNVSNSHSVFLGDNKIHINGVSMASIVAAVENWGAAQNPVVDFPLTVDLFPGTISVPIQDNYIYLTLIDGDKIRPEVTTTKGPSLYNRILIAKIQTNDLGIVSGGQEFYDCDHLAIKYPNLVNGENADNYHTHILDADGITAIVRGAGSSSAGGGMTVQDAIDLLDDRIDELKELIESLHP